MELTIVIRSGDIPDQQTRQTGTLPRVIHDSLKRSTDMVSIDSRP